MNARKPFLLVLLALCLSGPWCAARTVGLASDAVNPIYAEQKQSEWCWAACIQMIANLYGADVTQDEIVARSYGPGVNHAGSLEVITASLNGSGTTRSGRAYHVTSTMLGNRTLPAALVAELTAGRPVLLGCDAGGSGHAVVCTAVTYDGPADSPIITALTVRDPWPGSDGRNGAGRRVVSGADLGPRILEGWVIHIAVQDSDGQTVPAPRGYVFNDPDTRTFPNAARRIPPAVEPGFRRAASPANDDDDDRVAEPLRRTMSDAEKLADELLALLTSR